LASGTSGRTHGLLHSGARYCVGDRESAVECVEENRVLRDIAAQCIEPTGGLFVALDDDDMAYADRFLDGAAACGIPVECLNAQRALHLEPNLDPGLRAAFLVPDGTFDPLRLALAFAATARANGARFYTYSEVERLLLDGRGNVEGVAIWGRAGNGRRELRGDIVINAGGAWAGKLATLAGAQVPITPVPGIMVAFHGRLTQRAINRLNKPADGDILLPQRGMVVVGTTSFEVQDLDYVPVEREQIAIMVERGAALVPALRNAPHRGAYMATRPLVGAGGEGRSIARTFKCFDHQQSDGVDGFVTITGGKATTCRAMAEKVSDVVCAKLGVTARCATREAPLLSYRRYFAA
ncbi:MAG TPA: FAD-dependent oxidoreductase, partial [Roseiflexaceae bacterium]|nr:FAD-dependent oxidoreductase [Roseiflexaceae bacterium]